MKRRLEDALRDAPAIDSDADAMFASPASRPEISAGDAIRTALDGGGQFGLAEGQSVVRYKGISDNRVTAPRADGRLWRMDQTDERMEHRWQPEWFDEMARREEIKNRDRNRTFLALYAMETDSDIQELYDESQLRSAAIRDEERRQRSRLEVARRVVGVDEKKRQLRLLNDVVAQETAALKTWRQTLTALDPNQQRLLAFFNMRDDATADRWRAVNEPLLHYIDMLERTEKMRLFHVASEALRAPVVNVACGKIPSADLAAMKTAVRTRVHPVASVEAPYLFDEVEAARAARHYVIYTFVRLHQNTGSEDRVIVSNLTLCKNQLLQAIRHLLLGHDVKNPPAELKQAREEVAKMTDTAEREAYAKWKLDAPIFEAIGDAITKPLDTARAAMKSLFATFFTRIKKSPILYQTLDTVDIKKLSTIESAKKEFRPATDVPKHDDLATLLQLDDIWRLLSATNAVHGPSISKNSGFTIDTIFTRLNTLAKTALDPRTADENGGGSPQRRFLVSLFAETASTLVPDFATLIAWSAAPPRTDKLNALEIARHVTGWVNYVEMDDVNFITGACMSTYLWQCYTYLESRMVIGISTAETKRVSATDLRVKNEFINADGPWPLRAMFLDAVLRSNLAARNALQMRLGNSVDENSPDKGAIAAGYSKERRADLLIEQTPSMLLHYAAAVQRLADEVELEKRLARLRSMEDDVARVRHIISSVSGERPVDRDAVREGATSADAYSEYENYETTLTWAQQPIISGLEIIKPTIVSTLSAARAKLVGEFPAFRAVPLEVLTEDTESGLAQLFARYAALYRLNTRLTFDSQMIRKEVTGRYKLQFAELAASLRRYTFNVSGAHVSVMVDGRPVTTVTVAAAPGLRNAGVGAPQPPRPIGGVTLMGSATSGELATSYMF